MRASSAAVSRSASSRSLLRALDALVRGLDCLEQLVSARLELLERFLFAQQLAAQRQGGLGQLALEVLQDGHDVRLHRRLEQRVALLRHDVDVDHQVLAARVARGLRHHLHVLGDAVVRAHRVLQHLHSVAQNPRHTQTDTDT